MKENFRPIYIHTSIFHRKYPLSIQSSSIPHPSSLLQLQRANFHAVILKCRFPECICRIATLFSFDPPSPFFSGTGRTSCPTRRGIGGILTPTRITKNVFISAYAPMSREITRELCAIVERALYSPLNFHRIMDGARV